jgi:hypothetical protein
MSEDKFSAGHKSSAGHKFSAGQTVQFSPGWPRDNATGGPYTIVRLYPKVGNTPQYRIKSKRDGHERMVPEDQLDRSLGALSAKGGFALPSGDRKRLR